MSVVLDSSATLAWVYSDEVTDDIRRLFANVAEHGAWVPGIWRLEVANLLEMGVRRGRHGSTFVGSTLADLGQLPINVDPETDRQAWSSSLPLAQRYRLTMYGAAYLELALRRGLPLATLDQELRRASQAEGVVLLGA